MAKKAGLTLKNSKHIGVYTKDGKFVTNIPLSPHSKHTIKGITNTIMDAAGF